MYFYVLRIYTFKKKKPQVYETVHTFLLKEKSNIYFENNLTTKSEARDEYYEVFYSYIYRSASSLIGSPLIVKEITKKFCTSNHKNRRAGKKHFLHTGCFSSIVPEYFRDV